MKNSIERKIFLESSYEDDKISFLSKSIKDSDFDCFIDIGAYIGYYSLYFYKYKNIKKIISIEPNKDSFTNLLKNIYLNKFDISTFNFACSNTNGLKKYGFPTLTKKVDLPYWMKMTLNTKNTIMIIKKIETIEYLK